MNILNSVYFQQEKICPVCDEKFKTTRVRSSSCVVVKRDTDFCVYYKDINPLHYSIFVCPHCNYASLDKNFPDPLNPAEKLRLQKGLSILRRDEPDMTGERNAQLALRANELAIQSAQIKKAGPGLIGSLYLRAAWFAREIGQNEIENKYIEQARQLYKQSFEQERLAASKMSETRMMYIIGELHRRAGLYQEAVKWFSQVVSHKAIKKEPEIERLARDQWVLAKEEYINHQKNGDQAIVENDSNTVAIDDIKEPDVNDIEKTVPNELPRAVNRYKSKTYISLYNDQIEWLKELSGKNYDRTKVLVEKEVIIRAILDAFIENGLDLTDFKEEKDLLEKIKLAIKK